MFNKELTHIMASEKYHHYSATDNYILCFTRNKQVWAVEVRNVDALFIKSISYIEQRSSGWALRFRPTKAQQEIILAHATKVQILCTLNFLETEKVNHNNNRGDCVEDMATIAWNGVQPESRSTCFTDCGDFRANNIEYQVKYGANTGAATFTNEKTIYNIEAR